MKKTYLLFLLIVILSVFFLHNLGINDNKEFINEEKQILYAEDLVSKGDYLFAKQILEKYLNNERWNKSYVFCANYGYILAVEGDFLNAKRYMDLAFNQAPEVVKNKEFLNIYDGILKELENYNEKK